MLCPQCASPVEADDRFCTSCGAALGGAAAGARAVAAAADEIEPADVTDAEALPCDWLQRAPERSLREIYFELGLKLLVVDRAKEALAALDSAQREPGEAPPDADLALARAVAAHEAGDTELGARRMLEAALMPAAAYRREIVAHLLTTLTADAALAQGRWLNQTWLPEWKRIAEAPKQAALGSLLAARAQLLLANYEQAGELLREAAGLDGVTARAELARMLAPERLPRALAPSNADSVRVIAGLWQAVGDAASALAAIDEALTKVSGGNYPDAPLLALRADALLALRRSDEAAADLLKAGKRFVWRREGDLAAGLLERAIDLNVVNVEARWLLADSLLTASYRADIDDSQRRERLKRARAAWDAGRAIRAPGAADAWAYATRAYIVTREAELASQAGRKLAYWEAVVLTERALLLDPDESARWGNLAEFHRRLMNQQMALEAARRGHALSPKEGGPLSELVIVLANVGSWREASRALRDLEAIEKTAWTTFVAARLHLYNGKADAALKRIDAALKREPGDLTYMATRAMILRALDRSTDSRAQSAQILERWRLDDRDNVVYYGSAALDCGDFERARQAYEADLRFAGDEFSREASHRNLALAWLALAEFDKARASIDAGCRSAIDAEGRWLFDRDLVDLERQLAERHAKIRRDRAFAATRDYLRGKVESSPQAVAASARDEMEAALQKSAEPWQTVGALAGLARLDRKDNRHADAARRYAELEKQWAAQFPEAGLGIDAAVAGLSETLKVSDYWREREQTPAPNTWQQRLFATYLGDRFGLSADKASTTAKLLAVTQIAVELDQALVPPGESDSWPIIASYLPDLRQRIERDTGVKLPGVVLRSSDALGEGRFVVLLDDVPLVLGAVVPEASFCHADPAAIEAHGATVLRRETDPLTGAVAAWVASAEAPALAAAGMTLLDAQVFMVRQLESVLRRHLAGFVGVDEVDQQLLAWKNDLGRAEEIEGLRSDDEQLLRFTRLLRRLAREKLSIADGMLLLDVAADSALADQAEALRAARRRIVPATALADVARPVPADLEARCLRWLHDDGGKVFLAMPPEEAQEILGEFRSLVAEDRPAAAIVVTSAALRPHLRDLLEIEFPDLAVLASEERQGSAPAISGRARPAQVQAS